MAKALFTSTETQWFDDDGDPLAGGLIYFYEPGTTTLKNTYDAADLSAANTNPVVLDANGRGVIWLNGEYKYKVTTATGVDVGTVVDNLNTETASSVESGLLIANGSFEIDSEGLGQPDDWTIAPLTGATIAIDTTDSAHGLNSLKFISAGAGGGTATSNRFDVLKGQELSVTFTYKASSATVKTIVDVKTYDKNGGVLSTLNAYTEAAANPATYTTYTETITIDATAVTAEIVVTGIDAAGTITSGLTTHFDNIYVSAPIFVLNDKTATTSGTTVDYINIPKWVKRITVNINAVGTTDTTDIILRLGDSSSVEATGYLSVYGYITATTSTQTDTTFARIGTKIGLSDELNGTIFISMADNSTNTWNITGNVSTATDFLGLITCTKSLTGLLTRFQITTLGGTATFDNGFISVSYE